MKLDSAISLQAELLDQLDQLPVVLTSARRAPRIDADQEDVRAGRSRVVIAYAATRTSKVDPLARTIALGVSRKARNDYRLAVRLQRQALLHAPQLEAIRKRAKGEVDIQYIGRLTKRPVPVDQRRRRPLRIGLSVGHFRITAGTLGGFVKLRDGGAMRMLSNNHVFADENRGKEGDAIIQPGDADSGRNPADRVGTLAEYTRLSRSRTNFIDAALAKVDGKIKYESKTLHGHGVLKGTLLDPALIAGTVEKIGRTTGHTKGRVTAFNVRNVVVGYDIGNVRFDGQIEIEGTGTQSFSDGGDSGSIIFTTGAHLAVGLLFAGGDVGGSNNAGLTYANPIGQVLDRLNADLLL